MKAVFTVLLLVLGVNGFGGVQTPASQQFTFTSDDGLYTADIVVSGGMANVTVTAEVEASKWVAIGFNSKPSMPGGDYVIGWAKEDGSINVKDYHTPDCPCGPTPDHAIPTLDQTQDLIGVSGGRKDGKTTIQFSRQLNTGDMDDNIIDSTKSFVLFAWGGGYDAKNDVLTTDPSSVMSFYTTMHGYMSNRDVKEMSCLEVQSTSICEAVPTIALSGDVGPPLPPISRESLTAGSFYYEHPSKTYRVHFYPKGESVSVKILASVDPTKQWVSVGFNKNGLMQGADIFLAWMDSNGNIQHGDYSVTDYPQSHDTPIADTQNDYTDVTGSYENGVFSVEFTRLLDTEDSQDKVIDYENTVVLTAWGGVLDNGTFKVSTGFDNSQWGFRHTMDHRASVPWGKLKKL